MIFMRLENVKLRDTISICYLFQYEPLGNDINNKVTQSGIITKYIND